MSVTASLRPPDFAFSLNNLGRGLISRDRPNFFAPALTLHGFAQGAVVDCIDGSGRPQLCSHGRADRRSRRGRRLGLILNREMSMPLQQIWGQVSQSECEREGNVRHGGPVGGTLMAVHDLRPTPTSS